MRHPIVRRLYQGTPSCGRSIRRDHRVLLYGENQAELGLPDFLHDSQEVMAAHIMRKQGAIEPLLKGDLDGAIKPLNNIWTSLPGTRESPGTRERNVHTDSFKDRYSATLGLLRAQPVPYP